MLLASSANAMQNKQVHPIDELLEQYADTAADAERLVETQPAARLTSRPSPIRWSAVECLQHLTISNRQFLPRLEKALEQARGMPASDGPYGLSLMARLLLWILEPPVRLRFPTKPPFAPAEPQQPEEALREFLASHEAVAALLGSARGVALDKVEIVSPFAENVRYNAWATFRIIVAHERRHLWQAHQAVAL